MQKSKKATKETVLREGEEVKKTKKGRWSSWILKAVIIGSFFYIAKWGITSFIENGCQKCVLSNLAITGTAGTVILAILNEIVNLKK